ncbi:MAG: pentapeptide repeat-containing protein [Halobacteriota archaeon]|nr:pentapeptide repeat-containing protein [Halobacteriota archaeon]
MCEYQDDFGWKCPHETLPGSKYCIFHLRDDKKDVEAFNSGIDEILNTEEEFISFEGFYFPPGTSDFKERVFEKIVHFQLAEFKGKANFRSAEFNKIANFRSAEFNGEAKFESAEFNGEAMFELTKFKGAANLAEAKFNEETYFESAKFNETVDFRIAEFNEKANFRRTEFNEKAKFEFTKFKGEATFFRAEFNGKTDIIRFESKNINLEGTFFSENVRIEADLSKCLFNGSNIEKVDLTGSKLPEEKKKWFMISEGIKIREEIEGKLSNEELEEIYRRLKQSYQRSGDYSTAGEFYYSEMECKRKEMGFFQRQFWNFFYRLLCGYGERPFRVIEASLGLIIVFAVLYFFSGIMLVGAELPTHTMINYDLNISNANLSGIDYSLFKDFLWCCYTSVITFTTLGYGDVHPIGCSRLFAAIESALGIFMTALFIFVFGRKMLR